MKTALILVDIQNDYFHGSFMAALGFGYASVVGLSVYQSQFTG